MLYLQISQNKAVYITTALCINSAPSSGQTQRAASGKKPVGLKCLEILFLLHISHPVVTNMTQNFHIVNSAQCEFVKLLFRYKNAQF